MALNKINIIAVKDGDKLDQFKYNLDIQALVVKINELVDGINVIDIATNTTGIATNLASIGVNASGIATNLASIGVNASGIATNREAINNIDTSGGADSTYALSLSIVGEQRFLKDGETPNQQNFNLGAIRELEKFEDYSAPIEELQHKVSQVEIDKEDLADGNVIYTKTKILANNGDSQVEFNHLESTTTFNGKVLVPTIDENSDDKEAATKKYVDDNLLSGEQGPQGIPGEKGDKGDKGDPGTAGAVGVNGNDGIDGVGISQETLKQIETNTEKLEGALPKYMGVLPYDNTKNDPEIVAKITSIRDEIQQSPQGSAFNFRFEDGKGNISRVIRMIHSFDESNNPLSTYLKTDSVILQTPAGDVETRTYGVDSLIFYVDSENSELTYKLKEEVAFYLSQHARIFGGKNNPTVHDLVNFSDLDKKLAEIGGTPKYDGISLTDLIFAQVHNGGSSPDTASGHGFYTVRDLDLTTLDNTNSFKGFFTCNLRRTSSQADAILVMELIFNLPDSLLNKKWALLSTHVLTESSLDADNHTYQIGRNIIKSVDETNSLYVYAHVLKDGAPCEAANFDEQQFGKIPVAFELVVFDEA